MPEFKIQITDDHIRATKPLTRISGSFSGNKVSEVVQFTKQSQEYKWITLVK